ncbi:MAG: hypothetical protein IJN79_04795 [Clostridia bacterium]|nr:hypothetical protein [Clostridia bacterium]MBQ2948380.1 hypothetical protein [Clostridia bacterium]MBQ4609193.1 hypothetical protein [Clostridia bacterium]MBQ6857911.1 hypothetical protein [Clostridia bacterium]MBQ7052092.1 hypothetical protein [Clostridia bacterium]
MLMRLRAALTPQAAALLALLALGAAFLLPQDGALPLERRIEQTLSAMKGVGDVRVTIRVLEEQEAPHALSADAGEAGRPAGAVAVAAGADDPLVRLEIERALSALLGLPPSAVSVIAGGE